MTPVKARSLQIVLCMAVACSGLACLTTSVVEKAKGEPWHYLRVRQVQQAGVLDENLYLKLGIERDRDQVQHTIVLKVPVGNGELPTPEGEFRLQTASLSLTPPSVGSYVSSGEMPAGVTSVPVEFLETTGYEDLEDHISTLADGVHVLISQTNYFRSLTAMPSAPPEDGVVPKDAELLVVLKDPGHAPRRQPVSPFGETPHKRPAWYLVTPFSVIGDIVTFPIQLIGMLMIEC